MMNRLGRLAAVAGLAAFSCSCAHQGPRADQDTSIITIKKTPVARVEQGPVLIVRLEMSGHADYQWVVVPDEASRLYAVSLLKALKALDAPETVSVQTLADYVAGLQGEASSVEKRAAQIKADLAGHAAVVYSYENPPGKK